MAIANQLLLEDFDENGTATVHIDMIKVADDGTERAQVINDLIGEIYYDACDKIEEGLPFLSYELSKTDLRNNEGVEVVIDFSGKIKSMDKESTDILYRIIYDLQNGTGTWSKKK